MQDWVTQVLLPYAERCISTYKLRSEQIALTEDSEA